MSSRQRVPPRPTILVPLDGSQAATAALPMARVIANVLEATVHIVHVTPEPVLRHELLRKLGLRAEEVRGVVIDQAIGPVAEAIVREARQRHSALIVMSTYGRVRVDLIGPVAREVLELAPCPVLFVRPDVQTRPGGPGTALRRVLLPLDGTPSTTIAAAPCIDLAERSGAEIDILLVATAGTGRPEERGSFVAPRYMDQMHHEWPLWTQEFINRFCRCLGRCPTVAMRLSLAAGDPAEEILRLAEERESDLIALVWRGKLTHERGVIVREVLRKAPCPVMILRVSFPQPI